MVFNHLLRIVSQDSKIKWLGFSLLGLLLATRAIFIIPTIFLFIYYLRFSHKRNTSLALFFLSVLSFCLSFVPLWIRSFELSDLFTPFTIQASQLIPFSYILVFVLVSIILAFRSDDSQDIFLYSGYILFALILTYLVRLCVIHGCHSAIIQSKADITYLLFCVPFLASYLTNKSYAKPYPA